MKLLYLQGPRRVTALRTDIREEIKKEKGEAIDSGGDFYSPFWRDAKDHVFGVSELKESIDSRIALNRARTRLYRQLGDGFLTWWNVRRRWTNEPFQPAPALKTVSQTLDGKIEIKIASILAVRDGNAQDRYIYPYWFPDPVLNPESARLGIAVLASAFPNIKPDSFRFLDVIRGETFSIEKTPLMGNEYQILQSRFDDLVKERMILRKEYE